MQLTKEIEIAEQDLIDSVGPIAAEFFEKVLDLDMSEMLLTDLSSLRDFSFSGLDELNEGRPESATLSECHDYWDSKVIEKIKAVFGLELSSTRISLIELFAKLEALKATKLMLH